jgi:hypothetical protein
MSAATMDHINQVANISVKFGVETDKVLNAIFSP